MNLMAWFRDGARAHTLDGFPGGIHLPAEKSRSLQQPLRDMPPGRIFYLPLQPQPGQAARAIVDVGERVRAGQRLAVADSLRSAAVHAPTSGHIRAIRDWPMAHPSGLAAPCLELVADGQHDAEPAEPWTHASARTPVAILDRIRRGGLAGLGGAEFPTSEKLARDGATLHTLIVNGAECEPYITADQILMATASTQIIQGIRVIDQLHSFERILIGIEDDKPESIAAMQAAVPTDLAERLEVIQFPARYPSGGEKQLIQRLTGIEVPSAALPQDIGMLCLNVGTLAAVADSVLADRPLTSRIVTLTGDGVPEPGNIRVPLGTPIKELLAFCGVDTTAATGVIMGGPMMGFVLPDLTAPVMKSTNCLIVPGRDELPAAPPESACIRCGDCERVCPAGLLPQQLLWFARDRDWKSTEAHHLFDCIECGACAYVCPSHIPLVGYYRHAKSVIRSETRTHVQAEIARQRFAARQVRMDQENAEREARRQRRAEAARQRQQASDRPEPASATNTGNPGLDPVLARTRAALNSAETQLAQASGPSRKAMAMTVRKLQEKVRRLEQDAAESDDDTQP